MSIKVQQLSKLFEDQIAVNSISFSIEDNGITGFLGPNGAGKTTTMKMLTACIPPSQGVINICGTDLDQDVMTIKKKIGYLPESNPLYGDMYVKEYLEYAGSFYSLKGKLLKARVSEMIHTTGLEKEAHKKIHQLSKGYRQRVGLAQALLHDPQILILDEPTSGLDPNQLEEIRNLIRKLSKEKLILLSTHIMQEVQQLCSRVIIINQGKIVADCPIDSLSLTLKNAQKVEVQFAGKLDTILEKDLETFGSVEKVQAQTYTIQQKGTEDLRPEIFHWAVEKKQVLIGIQQSNASLEKVFKELTKTKEEGS